MKRNNVAQSKKGLKTKIGRALAEDMKILSDSMKSVLVDDLITAFESRLKVLNSTQVTVNFAVDSREVI